MSKVFIPDLSIIDVLANLGPKTSEIIKINPLMVSISAYKISELGIK